MTGTTRRHHLRGRRTHLLAVLALVGPLIALLPNVAGSSGFTTPIRHVVFLIQENHSFDNVLGAWCVQTNRCDGATSGQVSGGATITLSTATDKVPQVIHSSQAQTASIDGGKMDGFSLEQGCSATNGYKCYSTFSPSSSSISNVVTLATQFALSDRTFEDGATSSWGMHVQSVAATSDGFVGGGTPHPGTKGVLGFGWGCDSGRDTSWQGPTGGKQDVPACVPDPTLSVPNGGAYRPTPVPHVPTIMDSLDAASLSWRFYSGPPGGGTTGQGDASGNNFGYGWAVCPTFASCLNRSPSPLTSTTQFLTDAGNGSLPNFSVVTPTQVNSQHNGDNMSTGDAWIASVVNAVASGPDWDSTAIFITWDDCGCFYDHVAPPAGRGIRVPMLIVSPFALAGHTDSNSASFASVLAFTESVFGLPAISSTTWDGSAYNYLQSFNFSQTPLPGAHTASRLVTSHPPPATLPDPADPNDPT